MSLRRTFVDKVRSAQAHPYADPSAQQSSSAYHSSSSSSSSNYYNNAPSATIARVAARSRGGGRSGSSSAFTGQPRRRGDDDAGDNAAGCEEGEVEDEYEAEMDAHITKSHPVETDAHRLAQRQKQVDLGKSTPEYIRYLSLVPVNSRDYSQRFSAHPLTPKKTQVCSKRSFDGQIRKWRRLLHQYDDLAAADANAVKTEEMPVAADAEVSVSEASTAAPATAASSQPAPMANPFAFTAAHFAATGARSWADETDAEEAEQARAAAAAATLPRAQASPQRPMRLPPQPQIHALQQLQPPHLQLQQQSQHQQPPQQTVTHNVNPLQPSIRTSEQRHAPAPAAAPQAVALPSQSAASPAVLFTVPTAQTAFASSAPSTAVAADDHLGKLFDDDELALLPSDLAGDVKHERANEEELVHGS